MPPRIVPGVKSRVKDARAYFLRGRLVVLNPLFDSIRDLLGNVETLDAAATQLRLVRRFPVDTSFIRPHLRSLDSYHRIRFESVIEAAFGIDVDDLLRREPVNRLMRQALSDNVDLIRTIPRRSHDSLKKRLIEEFETRPFDRGRVSTLINREFGSQGFNLRRITRDQTSKLIGNLSKIRQTQIGVERYKWSTSQDERVRDTHVSNDGKIFQWDRPPRSTGHPGQDIMCRCVALPVIDGLPEI